MSPAEKASTYFSVMLALNNIKVSKRAIRLLSYIAVNRTLSSEQRKAFVKQENSTTATIDNLVSELKKIPLIVDNQGNIELNKTIFLDFTQPVTVSIILENGEAIH